MLNINTENMEFHLYFKNTPLHLVESAEIAHALIELGANPNIENNVHCIELTKLYLKLSYKVLC